MGREGMTFEQFKRLKTAKEHKYSVNNSYGVYDYYKYYRHNRPKDKSYYKMSEGQYYKLIRTVNEYLVDILFSNAQVILPNRLGELAIIRMPAKVTIQDGKLKTNRPINWDATIRLWFEDPEAEKKKTLVRWDTSEVLSIDYRKNDAIFHNRPYYEFKVIRKLKQRLSSLVAESDFETPFFIDGTVDNIKKLYNG